MTAGTQQLIGMHRPRREDEPLLTGNATFVADIKLPRMVEATFIRSPVAHARLVGIDVAAALDSPDVLFAGSGADLTGVNAYPAHLSFIKAVNQYPLARDRVRYVGSPVAVVVAPDRYRAEDAVPGVIVDYDDLPAITTIAEAIAPDAPRLYDDWPDNKILDFPASDPEVDHWMSALPSVKETFSSHRQSANPIETRGAVAEYRNGRLTVWSTTQMPHIARTTIAVVLGLPESKVRVIASNLGGGFGSKNYQYSEEMVVAWLAMRLRRPVRWIEDRAEHLISTIHAREQEMTMEAAYEPDGTIKAVRCDLYTNQGSGELYIPGVTSSLVSAGSLTGAYRIRHSAVSVSCVVTNKTPSGAYRGFGQPEAVFAMERTIELVARAAGVDSADIRKNMLLRPEEHPYTMPSGGIIDSGSHIEAFEMTQRLAAGKLAAARHRHVGDTTKRVGVGYAVYVEGTTPTYFGTTGFWTSYDSVAVSVEIDGTVSVRVPMPAIGQGVESLTSTVIADTLGVDEDKIDISLGDTDLAPYGLGSWGARGAVVTTGALVKASNEIIEKAKLIAAGLLEASPVDIELREGKYRVKGSPDSEVSLAEVAVAARANTFLLPEGVDAGLESTAAYDPPDLDHFPDSRGKMSAAATWSNASHAAIVVVDLPTGIVKVVDYVVVHDCGTVINPTIVEGQIEGGVAQGIGGALYEHVVYNEGGQPQSANFSDYLLPSAVEIPPITTDHIETPAPDMPLGVKGTGESGTIGGCGSIANAVADALSEFGWNVTATPITPGDVRGAIDAAGGPAPWDHAEHGGPR